MKKILALVMALCMLCGVAMAEEAEATYTYNTYMSEFPTVWSPFQQQTATDNELTAYLGDGFYDFDFNETYDGYVIKPAMAAEFPVDVTAEYVGEQWGIAEGETARAWKIALREDLKWQDGTAITAADFVKSAEYLLNPKAANYRADSYYSGQLIIKNAQGYAYSGREISYQENNTNGERFVVADFTKGEDGVYVTPQGKVVYIAVKAGLSDWLSGNSLEKYVTAYGDAYFGMENWDALLAAANEDGYVALTDETMAWLVSVIATNPAWGESEENVPDYLAYDYVNPTVAWEDVGLKQIDEDTLEVTLDGPYTKGTYLWVEVENLKRLEAKVVEGPYIHHCVGIHQDVVPVLYEACKYIGVTPDLYDNNEEAVRAFIRGE